MLSGATCRASAMAGTAVFRIVVSNDSIKNATATSQGNNPLADTCREGAEVGSGMAGPQCVLKGFLQCTVLRQIGPAEESGCGEWLHASVLSQVLSRRRRCLHRPFLEKVEGGSDGRPSRRSGIRLRRNDRRICRSGARRHSALPQPWREGLSERKHE